MSKKIYIITIILGSLILLYFDKSWMFGWLYGWVFAYIQRYFRNKYYLEILDFDRFSMSAYIFYLLISILLIVLPLIPAYYLNEHINLIAAVSAYAVDRLFIGIEGFFIKKEGGGDSEVSE